MVDVDRARARRLRQAREHAGYESAAEAADAIGVPSGTYGGHEAGTRGFRLEGAAHYAKFFGVRVEWLAFGRGAMVPSGNPAPIQARYEKLDDRQQAEVRRFFDFIESRDADK